MSTESPLATPLPWDLVSSSYDAEVVPVFETYARRALELVDAPAGARVVDVACGPGTLASLAAQAGFQVDALDFSPRMVALLEGKIARGLAGVTVRIGDGQALPYGDGVFAAGFSMFGLMFFPDRAAGFRELRRVLVPGARAVVSSWHPLTAVPAFMAMFGAVREVMPPSAGAEFPLTTADSCRAEMSAAFAGVEVHTVKHTATYPTTRELWQSVSRTMAPIVLLRERLGADGWREVEPRIVDTIVRELGDGAVEVTTPAWLTVGTAT
jgi:ubiquinone/menaquinone biosynthesis C-methylase UbiE